MKNVSGKKLWSDRCFEMKTFRTGKMVIFNLIHAVNSPVLMMGIICALFCPAGECFIERVYESTQTVDASSPAPQFDTTHSRDVTALTGQTAILNCRVHNTKNSTVSWIRHRDIHLLTVGKYTYTSDQRFRAIHEEDSEDWILKINYAQTRDTGIYECQVSTTPPISHFVKLKVVQPLTNILGEPDLHINRGSTINLTCIVQYSPEPPEFIYWNHNDKIISYDSERGGVTVIIEKGDVTTSSLLIQNAAFTDSGRYNCNPSNTQGANITVHVLSGGEHPAAMQHGGQSNYSSACIKVVMSLPILLLFLQKETSLYNTVFSL